MLITLSGCSASPQNTPTIDPTEFFQNALLTATYAVSSNPESTTSAPEIQAEITDTAPASTNIPATPEGPIPPLPEYPFSGLATGVKVLPYLQDRCEYLYNRWSPEKSEPGTVLIPVMYHAIIDDSKEITDQMFVAKSKHFEFMDTAHAYDFDVVNSEQAADFLYNNAKIPRLSLILIVDDRHDKRYFNEFFYPYHEIFQWSVTNAWISTPLSSEELWQQQVELSEAGWVDYQAHGVVHNIPVQDFPENYTLTTDVYGTLPADEFFFREITDPIGIFQQRFNKRPIAYIWPGGGFNQKGVDIAVEAGYKLGFSVFERGPILYNQVPQGIEEQAVNNPLMVLPRYWSSIIGYQLEDIIRVSDEAKAFALQNQSQEMEWYRIYCPHYPALTVQ